MRRQRRNELIPVSEFEQAAPPVSPIEALRRNLLHAIYKGVTGETMEQIVAAQAKKALKGDTRAAKLLIETVQAGGEGQARTTYMQQAVIANQPEKGVRFASEARRQIVLMLAETGPLTVLEVAKGMHLSFNEAAGLLADHGWFAKEGDKWNVTNQATLEAIPSR